MKADQARREARFIQWDVPASKQEVLSEELSSGKVARMDGSKITITAIGDIALRCAQTLEATYRSGNGDLIHDVAIEFEGMTPQSLWTFAGSHTQRVEVPRDALVKILNETVDDTVIFYCTQDIPLILFSSIGVTEEGDPKPCMAVIAPQVRD